MATLYITEQNAILRKTGDRVFVEKDDQVLLEVPCLKLESVFLFGNVQVTTQALAELLDHGIELALFSVSGRLRGQLTPPKAKNVELRMRQYELARSSVFCLNLAREIVQAKIENSLHVLRELRRNHPALFSPADIETLSVQAARVPQAGSLGSLRGLEGGCAATHFRLLGRAVPAELGFSGRERRPPPDPLNALLSFGYVLVGNEIQALLDGMGFDPYLGFLHQLDYGRPSLALDLVEEVRAPLVDRFSLRLVNLGILHKEDFVTGRDGGCFLNQDGKKRYFQAYEEELNRAASLDGENLSYRQLFRRQAERLARALTADEPYRSFRC